MSPSRLEVKLDKEKTWPGRFSAFVRHENLGISFKLDNGWLKERQPLQMNSENNSCNLCFPRDILALTLYFYTASGMTPHSSTEWEFPALGSYWICCLTNNTEVSAGMLSPLPLWDLPPTPRAVFHLAVSMVKVRERRRLDGFHGNSKGELISLVMMKVRQSSSEYLPLPSSHPA